MSSTNRTWRLVAQCYRRCTPSVVKQFIGRLRAVRLEDMPLIPENFAGYRSLLVNPEVERVAGGWIYRGAFYPDYLTVGGAVCIIERHALRYCVGTGIDLGAGHWCLPGATPVDPARGPGKGNSLEAIPARSLDFVFSSHCLEHIPDWQGMVRTMHDKLKVGGILFLYLPHPSCEIWLPGSPFVYDGHKWVPRPDRIKEAVAALGMDIVEADDGPDAMRSFFVVARKRS